MSQIESINDQSGESEERARSRRNTAGGSFRTIYVVILIAAVAVAAWSSYSYYQQKLENKKLTDPKYQAEVTKQEVNDLVSQVKKLMILPNEIPTVYIINDAAASMKDQAFYQGSVNGDRVLIYQKAMKAIIYSPSRNVIVNSGPVYVNNNQSQPAAAPKTATPTAETKTAQ